MAGKHTILTLSSITRVMYREENECGAGMAAMSLGQMLLMAELMLSRLESDWKERQGKVDPWSFLRPCRVQPLPRLA